MEKVTSYKDFEIIKILGKGSFGTVYKAKKKSDGIIYAIKEINIASMDSKTKQNTLNELRILASIDHPNIVAYKDFFLEGHGSKMCIVMELVGGGDLSYIISSYKRKKIKISEEIIWNYLIQILEGLKCLHEMKILHRDIKSANIFVSEDLKSVKLGDMNVAKISNNNLAKTQIGTPLYLPPEIWQNKVYDQRCDIFSLGIVIYELTSLNLPFNGSSMQELSRKIINGIYKRIPSCYSDDLYNIIKLMLLKDFKRRPTVNQLLNYPILINKRAVYNYTVKGQVNKLLGTIKIHNIKSLPKVIPKRYRANSANYLPKKNDSNKIKINESNKIYNSKKNINKLPPLPGAYKKIGYPLIKKSRENIYSNRNNSRNYNKIEKLPNRNNSKEKILSRNNSRENLYSREKNLNKNNSRENLNKNKLPSRNNSRDYNRNNSPMRYRNESPRVLKYYQELKAQQEKKVVRNRVGSADNRPNYNYRPNYNLFWK